MNENIINSENIVVGSMYLILNDYGEDPNVLKLESIGRSNANFTGSIPTRNKFNRLVSTLDIPKYVREYKEIEHRKFLHLPRK